MCHMYIQKLKICFVMKIQEYHLTYCTMLWMCEHGFRTLFKIEEIVYLE
jgi:hypothetical protein